MEGAWLGEEERLLVERGGRRRRVVGV